MSLTVIIVVIVVIVIVVIVIVVLVIVIVMMCCYPKFVSICFNLFQFQFVSIYFNVNFKIVLSQ